MHITDYDKVKSLHENSLFITDMGDEVGTKTIFAKELGMALLGLLDSKEFVKNFTIGDLDAPTSQDVLTDLIVGTQLGAKKLSIQDALFKMVDKVVDMNYRAYPLKNTIYRGKRLEDAYADKRKEAIQNGRFND